MPAWNLVVPLFYTDSFYEDAVVVWRIALPPYQSEEFIQVIHIIRRILHLKSHQRVLTTKAHDCQELLADACEWSLSLLKSLLEHGRIVFLKYLGLSSIKILDSNWQPYAGLHLGLCIGDQVTCQQAVLFKLGYTPDKHLWNLRKLEFKRSSNQIFICWAKKLFDSSLEMLPTGRGDNLYLLRFCSMDSYYIKHLNISISEFKEP